MRQYIQIRVPSATRVTKLKHTWSDSAEWTDSSIRALAQATMDRSCGGSCIPAEWFAWVQPECGQSNLILKHQISSYTAVVVSARITSLFVDQQTFSKAQLASFYK